MKIVKKKTEEPVVELPFEEEVAITQDSVPSNEEEGHDNVASSFTMENALLLVAHNFNLGDNFIMTKFADGAKGCSVTLANGQFEVTVVIKDKEMQGI